MDHMNDQPYPGQTADSAASDRCVLIIDDDALNLKLFAMTLTGRGYRVLLAMDARRGLDLAAQQHPDLIMMDIQLPDMSGLEATRTLKQDADTSNIPVLITTAFLVDSEELRASGCDAYLPKPFSGPQLLSVMDLLMAQSA
jgi:two-component system cell cycle response regulator DivK